MGDTAAALEYKAEHFAARIQAFYDAWPQTVDAIVFANGVLDEEVLYKKSTALQDWIFGREIFDVIAVATASGLCIVTSNSDSARMISAVVTNSASLKHVIIDASERGEEAAFSQLIDHIKASKGGVRVCSQQKFITFKNTNNKTTNNSQIINNNNRNRLA